MGSRSQHDFVKPRYAMTILCAIILSATTFGAESDSEQDAAWVAWKNGNIVEAAGMAEKLDEGARNPGIR